MRKFKNQIFSLVLSGVLEITTVGFINQPAVNNTVKADEIKETVSKSTIKPSFYKKGGFIFFKKVARIIRKHIDLN